MEDATSTEPPVPLLRGLLHAVSCPVALVAGGVLAWLAPTPRAAVSLLIMAVGFAAIFGTSGVYHRLPWSPTWKRRLRQVDHSMIFVGMATTYTAMWLVALDGLVADIVLGYVWIAALAGVVAKFFWLDARASRAWISYCAFGLVGLAVVPDLWHSMGPLAVILMLLGAVAFAAGGAAYALGRPNPVPGWFGHHEVFHAGTIAGAALYISALAHFALR
ncbi:MAG: Hly-III family protein [Thermoleophilia bacterium]|nr:Hly-III family protein [Thermoleophilia bacterium]